MAIMIKVVASEITLKLYVFSLFHSAKRVYGSIDNTWYCTKSPSFHSLNECFLNKWTQK